MKQGVSSYGLHQGWSFSPEEWSARPDKKDQERPGRNTYSGISTQRAALILHGNLNTDCEIDHFTHWVLFKLGFSVLSPEVTRGAYLLC